jgi:DNA-binding GntR family transcriptional regulator
MIAGRRVVNEEGRRMNIAEKRSARMQLPQVSRPLTVKEQVYLTLREQLTQGHSGPDERVVEKDLTEQLGVSRTPVREALSRLASEGFLVATRHGYKIPVFTPEDVEDLFEVRLLLEPAAARQAAENPTNAGLDDMREAIAEEKSAHEHDAVTRFLKAHGRFREAWLSRAHNRLLLEALGKTLHSLQFVRRRTMSDALMRAFMIDSHLALLAAIEACDVDQAQRVQMQTIAQFKQLIMERVFAGTTIVSSNRPNLAR